MDKKERKRAKRQFKKKVETLFGKRSGCCATYRTETQDWELYLSVDFDIPQGLEHVVNGSEKDAKQEEVRAFMEVNRLKIEETMFEQFRGVPCHQGMDDYNFTQTFPPMFSLFQDKDGVRLKTPEELQRDKVKYPQLIDMIEHDEEIHAKGYYVFEGTEEYKEQDGYRLAKYASLRARYTFIVPRQKEDLAS